MINSQVYEGTLDEITAQHGEELAGRRIRVIVQDTPASEKGVHQPLYESAAPDDWAEALRSWAASHNPSSSLLSDAAIDRDSIYAGRGE